MDLPSSTFAGIVTAIASVFTALGGLLVAVRLLIPLIKKVDTVHVIVNQQRTDAQRYQIALIEVLKKHGIDVPTDQSLPVVSEPDARPGQPTGD